MIIPYGILFYYYFNFDVDIAIFFVASLLMSTKIIVYLKNSFKKVRIFYFFKSIENLIEIYKIICKRNYEKTV